ncbi:MAG: hypothetical protein ABW061_11385 [Polyangiaceae bacterium]
MGSLDQAIRRNLARLFAQRGFSVASIALLAWSAVGCQASASGSLKTHVRHDAEEGPEDQPDLDKPVVAKSSITPVAAKAPGEVTLLGARHDMSLVIEHANAACACLKVAIGSAPSAAFQWQGPVPALDNEMQLALALSSESMACKDEPKGSSGASYWGYRISGNDVIVFVEGARAGRPRTGAAIIPKPVGDGQVFIAPAKSKMPYGRSLDGKSERCKIGNVPTKRSVPFTVGELGDTSLKDANTAPTVDGVE